MSEAVQKAWADRGIVERALLPYGFDLMMRALINREAWHIREDIHRANMLHSGKELAKLDQFTRVRLGQRIEKDGLGMLVAGRVEDNLRHGILAVSRLAISLHGRGKLAHDHQAVLTGTALLAEAQTGGGDGDWRWVEGAGQAMASKMDNWLLAQGYFGGDMVAPAA